jgi:hypothetical protein
MSTHREAADEAAKAVSLAGLAEKDDGVAVTYLAMAGIIGALLDVADAIREQTKALDVGGVRDDLADIAHAARHERA